MTADYTTRLLIHGRVQGVWFRASAQRQATRLELTGWVRNLPDGTVEALASGDRVAVERFVAWCGQGPPGADVIRVETLPTDDTDLPASDSGFDVRR